MVSKKRFKMETIGNTMLPFIVDITTAKMKSNTITTYHTYETHTKEKCLELVDLLNEQHETIQKLEEYSQRINETLQSFSKRDLTDIERIFLNNLCNEIGVDLE